MPCPCRVATDLDCVFPFWITQCDSVGFTHTMSCPCRAPTLPLCKRLLKAMAQHGVGTAWYVCIHIGRSVSSDHHTEFHDWQFGNLRLHANFHEGHGTVGGRQGHSKACVIHITGHGRGMAWYVCELACSCLEISSLGGWICLVPSVWWLSSIQIK